MGETFDAASRLREGLQSVDDVQTYVSACHALGYEHPDLTVHAAQVRDWYGTEDGLELAALEADGAALRAVAASAEDALARQDGAAMASAWQGRGADASQEFLRRHREAAALAVAAVRTAGEALADLRNTLWRVVDGKVASALTIGDGARDRRAEWLAAARTVTTGAGDRSAASELVDQEVKPFVDNSIGAEWVTAMRNAIAAVTAAYDAASAELASVGVERFEVPGNLGPAWTSSRDDDGATTTPAAGTPGGAVVWGPPAASTPTPWAKAPVAPMPAPPAAPMPAAAAPPVEPLAAPALPPPSMPSLGGGLPDVGSGLSSLGQQIGETLGGLFGSADGLSPEPDDPLGIGEPDEVDDVAEEVDHDEEDDVDAAEGKPGEAVEPTGATVCEPEPQAVELAETAEPPLPEPVPTPAPMPPPVEAPPVEAPPLEPPPSPVADAETPCEVAAGELPQVGE